MPSLRLELVVVLLRDDTDYLEGVTRRARKSRKGYEICCGSQDSELICARGPSEVGVDGAMERADPRFRILLIGFVLSHNISSST